MILRHVLIFCVFWTLGVRSANASSFSLSESPLSWFFGVLLLIAVYLGRRYTLNPNALGGQSAEVKQSTPTKNSVKVSLLLASLLVGVSFGLGALISEIVQK